MGMFFGLAMRFERGSSFEMFCFTFSIASALLRTELAG
jgi:hypothetical protein